MTVYLEFIAIASLMVAMASIWSQYTYAWTAPFVLFAIAALVSGWITPIAFFPTAILALFVYYSHCATIKIDRILSTVLLTLFSIVFATHNLPGFETITFYEDVFISERKGASSLRFYADKPLIGFMLLLSHRRALCATFSEFIIAVKQIATPLIVGILSIYIIGYIIGFIRFDITIGLLMIPWLLRNLMFTVIAEEMILRGVVQDQIESAFKNNPNARWYALIIASGIFGLVHLYAGWALAILATLAGMLYGYVYIRTRKIETAIFAHIALNAGTAALFYYPLATAT